MTAPNSLFSKLSIESMSPTTRSQTQRHTSSNTSRSPPKSHFKSRSRSQSQSGSNLNSEPPISAMSAKPEVRAGGAKGKGKEPVLEGGDSAFVRSPSTKLRYSLSNLPLETHTRIEDTFREPSQISLHHCRLRDGVYAFQMTEMVPHSIRIGAPGSRHSRPTCSCAGQEPQEGSTNVPCKHLIWLLDQVAGQATAYTHNPMDTLTLNTAGYSDEMGDPFKEISQFHLDVLADSLRCSVVPNMPLHHESSGASEEGLCSDVGEDSDAESDCEEDDTRIPSPRRVLEAREILSSVAQVDVDAWRTDLSGYPRLHGPRLSQPPSHRRRKSLIRRGDLEATIFRMLVTNDHIFQCFLDQLTASDPVHDPFRKLGQRVDKVLGDLDCYAASHWEPSPPTTAESSKAPAVLPPPPTPTLVISAPGEPNYPSEPVGETPRSVSWAAKHIKGVVNIINTVIFTRDRPLLAWEERSAARALVHILVAIVARDKDFHPGETKQDRNLYARLVGDTSQEGRGKGDFILAQLSLIPMATGQFLDTLQQVLEQLEARQPPGRYTERLRALIVHCRGGRKASGAVPGPGSSSPGIGSKRPSQPLESEAKRMR